MSSLLPRVGAAAEREVAVLGDDDRDDLEALVDADPYVNVVVAARLHELRSIEPRVLGGSVLGVRDGTGVVRAAAFHGGNLLPLAGDPRDWAVIAGHLRGRRRLCTSIVGRADAVTHLWSALEHGWGPPRAIRDRQPLLMLDDAGALPVGDPRTRRVDVAEIEDYLPAAAAMFTEELGVSPFRSAGSDEYRRRVSRLVEHGRAFAIRDDDGRVAFKADIGAVSLRSCQVQGVWVRPELRGRGLGGAGLAVVLRHALTLAPTASLYVNDFNLPARRMYRRLGMREVASLSTVLF